MYRLLIICANWICAVSCCVKKCNDAGNTIARPAPYNTPSKAHAGMFGSLKLRRFERAQQNINVGITVMLATAASTVIILGILAPPMNAM